MSNVFRTMIVSAQDAQMARDIAAAVDPANSTGMWETPLSPTGAAPATHYISTGYVSELFAAPLPFQTWVLRQTDPDKTEWVLVDSEPGDPIAVYEACQLLDPPAPYTLEEIEALWLEADVTDQDPWVALGRLGLSVVQESVDG
jgi:hypothetical protein